MNCIEYGKQNEKVILLLHGGGLGPWNFSQVAFLLKKDFHVIVPFLDGHKGSDAHFISIEKNAKEIIKYIDQVHNGCVYMIVGLSLGAQVALDILSSRRNICKKAVIESAFVKVGHSISEFVKWSVSLSYPLIKKRWFAKIQSHSLHIPDCYFEKYYQDSQSISKEDMIAFLQANLQYSLKKELCHCQAFVLVLVGGEERRCMLQSSQMIYEKIPNCKQIVLNGYRHGELCLANPEKYVECIKKNTHTQ